MNKLFEIRLALWDRATWLHSTYVHIWNPYSFGVDSLSMRLMPKQHPSKSPARKPKPRGAFSTKLPSYAGVVESTQKKTGQHGLD